MRKIMDYEKKYKEALERVRRLHDRMLVLSSTDALVASAELEFIFPELTESEDERTRKEIIEFIRSQIEDGNSVGWDRWIAYLEKQKEQDWNKKPCLTCQEYENGHKQGYTEGCTAGYNKAMKEVEQEPIDWSKTKINGKPISTENKSVNIPLAEWSEADEKTINDACCWIAEYAGYLMDKNYGKASMLMSLTEKLKSLRPQYHGDVTMTEAYKMGKEAGEASHWKPSEEDLMMLEHIIEQYETGNKNSKVMGYFPRVEELNFLKKVLAIWKSDD